LRRDFSLRSEQHLFRRKPRRLAKVMSHQRFDLERLRLLGGRLCLDFVNSIENRAGEQEDFLTSYPDLARWARHAGLIDDDDAARLLALAAADAPAAEGVFTRALALRAALHRLFLAIATEQQPDAGDLDQARRAYAEAIAGATLTDRDGRFAWNWTTDEPRLEQILWPVAASAIDLLTAGDVRRIKVCANPLGCGWLFYDSSKNGSRRWCSMEGCGSQIKMRRQYAKRRATASA
jgi:predicted RNA-binding Zn ribbon-like protein